MIIDQDSRYYGHVGWQPIGSRVGYALFMSEDALAEYKAERTTLFHASPYLLTVEVDRSRLETYGSLDEYLSSVKPDTLLITALKSLKRDYKWRLSHVEVTKLPEDIQEDNEYASFIRMITLKGTDDKGNIVKLYFSTEAYTKFTDLLEILEKAFALPQTHFFLYIYWYFYNRMATYQGQEVYI